MGADQTTISNVALQHSVPYTWITNDDHKKDNYHEAAALTSGVLQHTYFDMAIKRCVAILGSIVPKNQRVSRDLRQAPHRENKINN